MLESLIGPVSNLLDKFVEDKDQKARLTHELTTMAERHAHEIAKSQIEVNKVEAGHKSLFVAGWRPAMGWICGLGFGMNFIIAPIFTFATNIAGYPDITFPQADLEMMMPVLLGMLGIGGLRTVEKVKSKARESL